MNKFTMFIMFTTHRRLYLFCLMTHSNTSVSFLSSSSCLETFLLLIVCGMEIYIFTEKKRRNFWFSCEMYTLYCEMCNLSSETYNLLYETCNLLYETLRRQKLHVNYTCELYNSTCDIVHMLVV